jgi:hypothetical protein
VAVHTHELSQDSPVTFAKVESSVAKKNCRFLCDTSSKRGANAGQSACAVMYVQATQPRKVMPIDDSRTLISVVVESMLLLFACVDSCLRNKSRSLCFWYLKASGNTCLLIFDYCTDISAVVVVVGCTGILYYGRYCLLSETS